MQKQCNQAISIHAFQEHWFLINGPGKEEWRSLALEQARWPLLIKANFGVQIILFKLEKLKKIMKGKKVIAKGLHEACYSRIQIMTMNEWLEEHFEWFFHKLHVYNIHFFLNACEFLPLKLFSIVTCTLKTIASNNLKLHHDQWNDTCNWCQ